MSAAPPQFLPKRTIFYLEYGRLAERVMRDSRLCPLARVFILTVAYLTNFKEVALSWKEIEQYAGAGRGTFYWAESLFDSRGLSPMQEAINYGYLHYTKGVTRKLPIYHIRSLCDEVHRKDELFDASHLKTDELFDASHLKTDELFDASHLKTDELFDASHLKTNSGEPFNTSKTLIKQEGPHPVTQVSPPARAREEREISASGDLRSRRSMHQERDHARAAISVHKPVDKPLFRPSGDLEFPRLSDSQLGTMHQMWSEQGIASYEIQDAIELAAKAVVESGIQPFQVVNIVKTLKAHYDPPGWPANFRKLLDAAIEKRHQPP